MNYGNVRNSSLEQGKGFGNYVANQFMQGEVDTKALRQQKSTANRNLVAPQVLKPGTNIDRKVNPELLKRVSIITKSIILRILVRRRSNFLQGERLKNSRPIT